MREILFRGKDEEGNWVEGVLICANEYCCILQDEEKVHPTEYPYLSATTGCIDGYATPVIPETIGQFTGLTDKNGKKIFEGDIVICGQEINGNFIDKHIEKGYVEMKHGAFGLHRKQGYYRPFKDWLEDYEYEVIGNIHDNPELLKGGADND